ncbi:MAG: hypothetical protein LQ350_002671 [Teloschistes chrysophthalmus]|nr:MAG: hypothetical protein LQ350_002671 [Niorma chrysophthalma]
MSQSYIEAHRAESAVRALEQKVTLLMTKNSEQRGKNEAFEKKLQSLEKRNNELEIRLKASYAIPSPSQTPSNRSNPKPCALTCFIKNSEHNALARHLNALLPPTNTSHTPLHPLHSIHTNTPLPKFPKKESDIRTMSALDVSALLQDLDASPTKTIGAGERKARLKEVIGVGERSNIAEAVREQGLLDGEGGKKEEEKKAPAKKLPGKATAPPPGKVLPIEPKD